jgi:hypothetical protein
MTVAALGTLLIGRLPQRGGLWIVVVGAFLFLSWLCGALALRQPEAAVPARAAVAADEAALGS